MEPVAWSGLCKSGFVLVSRLVSGGLRWADVHRTRVRARSNHARSPPVVDRAW